MITTDAIFTHSPYLQYQLTRHPEWQTDAASSQRYAAGELVQNIRAAIMPLVDHDSVLRTVRFIRNREMVRIAYRDLQGLADLSETLQTTRLISPTVWWMRLINGVTPNSPPNTAFRAAAAVNPSKW